MGIPNAIETVIQFPNRLTRNQMLEFVSAAGKFESNVFICDQEVRVNGKGLLGMNLFFLSHGSKDHSRPIILKVEGRDALSAMTCLTDLIESYLY